MSSRSKGMSYEREFEELLNSVGYVTQRVKGSTKFNKNVDFFGLFDIIAFSKVEWLLIQVKHDYRNEVCDRLISWYIDNKPPKTTVIYAVRRKGKSKHLRWRLVVIGDKITEGILNPEAWLSNNLMESLINLKK